MIQLKQFFYNWIIFKKFITFNFYKNLRKVGKGNVYSNLEFYLIREYILLCRLAAYKDLIL